MSFYKIHVFIYEEIVKCNAAILSDSEEDSESHLEHDY
jgi:hypothetical protein